MKISLYLKSRANIDGSNTIYWNLYDSKSKSRVKFSSGQKIHREDWDEVNHMPNYEKAEALFDYLYGERKRLQELYNVYEGNLTRVKEEYLKVDRKITLKEGLGYVVASSSKRNTITHWKAGVRSFSKVYPNIALEDITREKVERWKAHCYQEKENSHGGVRAYMNALQKVYNYCADHGLFEPARRDPFKNKPKTAQGVRRVTKALSREELHRFLKAEHEHGHEAHQRARDIVLLCLLLRGLDYVDLVSIKTKDLSKEGDYITTGRIKNQPDRKNASTSHKYDRKMKIWLHPLARKLIQQYRGNDTYLFNFYMRDVLDPDNYHSYRQNLQRHNKRTKKLAENAGLDIPVTTKVVRHTFATIAEEVLNSVRNTGVLMGHSVRGLVTETYIAETKQERIDEWHKDVLRSFEPL